MGKAWAFVVKEQADKRVLDDAKGYLTSISIYSYPPYLSHLSSTKRQREKGALPPRVTVTMTWSTVKNDDVDD